MSGRPLNVSVVIPTLNSEGHLSRCLDSVIAQGSHVHEILVVDGGSTDSTLACARSYAGVAVLDDQPYSLTQAWNAGLARATGEWIGFIDSDDWWSSDALGSHAAAIASVSARFGTNVPAVTGQVAYCLEGSEAPAGFRKDLLKEPRIGWMPGTTLVHQSTAQNVGPMREDLGVVSDIDWVDRLRRSHQVALNSNVVLFKSVRESSVSMKRSQQTMGASEYSQKLLTMLRKKIH